VAQALELLAGGSNPSVASDRWYRDSTAQPPGPAQGPGELRLVMNLESLGKSVYFRSYWVQRNASAIRRYWAGVADVKRTGGDVVESRVFLRAPDAPEPAPTGSDSAAVSGLLALVPPEAGLYKASRVSDSSEVAGLIVQKLIGPHTQPARDWREAPSAVSPDSRAGSEADLETRIDEHPLPSDAGIADSVAVTRAMVDRTGVRALLLVQSSSPAAGTFVQMPSVIVLQGAADWDRDSVGRSLTAAAGKLWTTSQLGAGWVSGTAGRYPMERLDGLGTLVFATSGRLLFLGNDVQLLTAVLDRIGTIPADRTLTYAAGFRHIRERASYERVMAALDFTSPAGREDGSEGAPAFFSGNMASVSRVLSKIAEIRVTEEERNSITVQTVVYRMAQ
jgi:hypothetical protein